MTSFSQSEIYQIIFVSECSLGYFLLLATIYFNAKKYVDSTISNRDRKMKLFGHFVVVFIIISYILIITLFLLSQIDDNIKAIINMVIYPFLYFLYNISFSIVLFLWTKYHGEIQNIRVIFAKIINFAMLLFSTVLFTSSITTIILLNNNWQKIVKYQAILMYIPIFIYLTTLLVLVRYFTTTAKNCSEIYIFKIMKFLRSTAQIMYRQFGAFIALMALDIISVFIDGWRQEDKNLFISISFPIYLSLACYCVALQATVLSLPTGDSYNLRITTDEYSSLAQTW